MSSTRLFLMAKLTARFMARNDFPLPGLKEVTTSTFWSFCDAVMKSMLERSTRNASLMTSRLPSLTTMAFLPGFTLRLTSQRFCMVKYCGISPMTGTLMPSRSFLPRTTVLVFSRMTMMPTGMHSPRAKAMSRMLLRTGAVGTMLPSGLEMTRVL